MASGTDDLVSGSKLGKWLVVAIIVIGIPSFLLTDFALEKAQKMVMENEKKPWAGSLQGWIATGYSTKFNHRVAAERYEWASRFAFAEGDEDAGAWLLYSQASETESIDANGKYVALPIYERLAAEFPQKEVGSRAAKSATRIKTMSRP